MMEENHAACYAALKSRDARFDGHFFVGVTSTGVYCRPVCRARLPKPENCRFFATAAQAEHAGFRPCLQCRPELAPGAAPVDAHRTLAQLAARALEENCADLEGLAALAGRLGCTDRHLRRVFVGEYQLSPVAYLQSCRLLLAKSLLTDTSLSVLDVAMAAGFGSLRRFNDCFKKQYRLAPTALRKQAAAPGQAGREISLLLGYRPPYEWDKMLAFLSLRAIPGVELVREGAYYRTVRLITRTQKAVRGFIRVENVPDKNAVRLTLSPSLLSVLPQVLSRVKRLFDLACDPALIYETLRVMDELRPGLCVPGVRLPGCFDPFEMAVRAVLGQQITVKAAGTLAGRLAQAYGTPVETGVEGLTHTFPGPGDILALGEPLSEKLGPLGVIATRSRTIYALAAALERGEWDAQTDPFTAMDALRALPGIGDWTAQYIAMRAWGWTDAFPVTDLGVKKALAPRDQKESLALAESWRPWRSYATIQLWNAL